MPQLGKFGRLPAPSEFTYGARDDVQDMQTDVVASHLQDVNQYVRLSALGKLRRQDPRLLSIHAGIIAKHLQERIVLQQDIMAEDWSMSDGTKTAQFPPLAIFDVDEFPWPQAVGDAVIEALNRLEMALKVERTGFKKHGDEMYSCKVFNAIDRMDWSVLTEYSIVLAQRCGCSSLVECCATLVALGRLEPQCLSDVADVVVSCLSHKSLLMRFIAVVVLERLDPPALRYHAAALSFLLRDDDLNVRQIAMMVFERLELEALGTRHLDSSLLNAELSRESSLSNQELLDEFNVSGPPIMFPQGNTLLHAAASFGLARLAFFLVYGCRGVFLDARNDDKDTPLHLAARGGHLDICHLLVKNGALIKAKNCSQNTPEDLARNCSHTRVAECLYTASNNIQFVRSGAGDAYLISMKDHRQLMKVAWHVMSNDGVFGAMGGKHSFLIITVSSLQKGATSYILEKAAVAGKPQERIANGVYVSLWQDGLAGCLDEPIHVLDARDIQHRHDKGALSMNILRNIAVELGPYNVGKCNCHHMAMAVYNACAVEEARVTEMPNAGLIKVVQLLSGIGLQVGNSEVSGPIASVSHGTGSNSFVSTPCGASKGSVPFQSTASNSFVSMASRRLGRS